MNYNDEYEKIDEWTCQPDLNILRNVWTQVETFLHSFGFIWPYIIGII